MRPRAAPLILFGKEPCRCPRRRAGSSCGYRSGRLIMHLFIALAGPRPSVRNTVSVWSLNLILRVLLITPELFLYGLEQNSAVENRVRQRALKYRQPAHVDMWFSRGKIALPVLRHGWHAPGAASALPCVRAAALCQGQLPVGASLLAGASLPGLPRRSRLGSGRGTPGRGKSELLSASEWTLLFPRDLSRCPRRGCSALGGWEQDSENDLVLPKRGQRMPVIRSQRKLIDRVRQQSLNSHFPSVIHGIFHTPLLPGSHSQLARTVQNLVRISGAGAISPLAHGRSS